MIPVSDALRLRRVPLINLSLIIINILVFIYEVTLPDAQLQRFVQSYGVVPRELFTGPPSVWLTLISSMFIHGGWLHIMGNMLYLWVFGDNVEDALGGARYIILYLAAGVIAGLTQAFITPTSTLPSIGASGAIAGVLAAYFVLFPRARVTTLIFLGIFFTVVQIPALILIGFWIVIQFFSGVASLGVPAAQTGGVAYWAHIGGFLGGLVLILLLRRRTRWSRG